MNLVAINTQSRQGLPRRDERAKPGADLREALGIGVTSRYLQHTEALIGARLTEADDRRLVEDFLKEVERQKP